MNDTETYAVDVWDRIPFVDTSGSVSGQLGTCILGVVSMFPVL